MASGVKGRIKFYATAGPSASGGLPLSYGARRKKFLETTDAPA
jgi:hypothetical protein